MKHKPRQEEDTNSWMNTYSDLVTLLLCFFVLLFSMSSVDAEKWEAFVKALAHPGDETAQVVLNSEELEPGEEPLPNNDYGDQLEEVFDPTKMPEDFNDLYIYLQKYVEENDLQSTIKVMRSGDSVVYIRFQNNIFFDPDKYYLRPQAYDILHYVGDCLHSVEEDIYIISINGHTADVEYENYAVSDWMLSSERASSVAIFFDDEKDIDPQKLRPIGYGKNFPVAPNDTQQGREQNRRVDITIVKNQDESGSGIWSEEELAGLFDPTKFPRFGGTGDILIPDNSAGSNTEIDALSPPVPSEGELMESPPENSGNP